jgi:hypothetical protein
LSLQNLLESKSKLFTIVVIAVVGTLAVPIIIPHIFHGFHIYHILLHVASISLAAFLTILSLNAYLRLRTKRMIITTIAFSIFIMAEIVTLIDVTWPTLYDIGDLALLEVGHVLMIVTLGLLAMGVFRND